MILLRSREDGSIIELEDLGERSIKIKMVYQQYLKGEADLLEFGILCLLTGIDNMSKGAIGEMDLSPGILSMFDEIQCDGKILDVSKYMQTSNPLQPTWNPKNITEFARWTLEFIRKLSPGRFAL